MAYTRKKGIRYAVKSYILTHPAARPDEILAALGASTEDSITSIRSDFLACMHAGRDLGRLKPWAVELVSERKAEGRLAMLNKALWHDSELSIDDCRAILERAGFSGFALSKGFIGPSIKASLESMDVLREASALNGDLTPIPELKELIHSETVHEEEARKLDWHELLQRARDNGQRKPDRRLAVVYYYARRSVVAVTVRLLANGFCHFCGGPAPFATTDGVPYLECHQVKMLAEGGLDTLDNTVALCPNCHRRLHTLNLASDKARLRKRIGERDGDVEVHATIASRDLP